MSNSALRIKRKDSKLLNPDIPYFLFNFICWLIMWASIWTRDLRFEYLRRKITFGWFNKKVKRKKKPKILSLANGIYKLKEKFYLVLHKRNILIETSNSFNSFDILQDPFIFLIILYCELWIIKKQRHRLIHILIQILYLH